MSAKFVLPIMMFKLADIIGLWMLNDDSNTLKEKQIQFTTLSIVVILLIISYFYYLYTEEKLDFYSIFLLSLQIIFYSITLAMINFDGYDIGLVRKTFLVWLTVMIITDNSYIIYSELSSEPVLKAVSRYT